MLELELERGVIDNCIIRRNFVAECELPPSSILCGGENQDKLQCQQETSLTFSDLTSCQAQCGGGTVTFFLRESICGPIQGFAQFCGREGILKIVCAGILKSMSSVRKLQNMQLKHRTFLSE